MLLLCTLCTLLFVSQAGKEGPAPAAHHSYEEPVSPQLGTYSPSKAVEGRQSSDALEIQVQLLMQALLTRNTSGDMLGKHVF